MSSNHHNTNHPNQPAQLPQQAGRFKPRKASVLASSSSGRGNTSVIIDDNHTPSSSSLARSSAARSTNEFHSNANVQNHVHVHGIHSPKKNSTSSGTRTSSSNSGSKTLKTSSRGGRGRGSASGTNMAPKGQVFFTGAMPSSKDGRNENHPTSSTTPFKNHLTNHTSANHHAHGHGHAQDRLLASAMARRGEGEEIIVGTLDYDAHEHEDQDQDTTGKESSKPFKNKRSSLQDDHVDDDDDYYSSRTGTDILHVDYHHHHDLDYTYDSDSSQDYTHSHDDVSTVMVPTKPSLPHHHHHPQQLPFPPPRRIGTANILEPLYSCQHTTIPEEQDHEDNILDGKKHVPKSIQDHHSIYSDPPLKPPFVTLNHPDDQKEESSSWMLFKFPTRLPRLAPHCIHSNLSQQGRTKMDHHSNTFSQGHGSHHDSMMDSVPPNHFPEDPELLTHPQSSSLPAPPSSSWSLPSPPPPMMIPDVIPSSSSSQYYEESKEMQTHLGTMSAASSFRSSALYDDTLKDTSAGRYGKIVVHKSGKAYLIVGGADSKTPQVKMLLQNGLSCGFLQQAVSIRTTERGDMNLQDDDDDNNKEEERDGEQGHDSNPNGRPNRIPPQGGSRHRGSFIPLGEVHRTIVVTPDVETAF